MPAERQEKPAAFFSFFSIFSPRFFTFCLSFSMKAAHSAVDSVLEVSEKRKDEKNDCHFACLYVHLEEKEDRKQ